MRTTPGTTSSRREAILSSGFKQAGSDPSRTPDIRPGSDPVATLVHRSSRFLQPNVSQRPFTISPRRGQSILEQSVLLAALCIALAGMMVYIKRAIAGRMRASADAAGEQFSPKWSNYTYTTMSVQRVENKLQTDGEASSTLLNNAIVRTKGKINMDDPLLNTDSYPQMVKNIAADAQASYIDEFSNKKVSEEEME